MFFSWNAVTLVMVLDKAGATTYDGKAVGYVVTEVVSTILFGIVTVGRCEKMEGLTPYAAHVASMLSGDNTSM